MNSLFALRTLLFVGELFVASTLMMLLAWPLSQRKTASERHLTWLGAIGALLALPVLAGIMPSIIRLSLASPLPQTAPTEVLHAAAIALPAPASGGYGFDPATIALAVGALWLAGVCAVALRLAIGAFCVAALKRQSRVFALAPDNLPKIAAAARECELRLSHAEHGPLTCGVFRPVILLPKRALFWPRERLHAVLLHELAHIRRRDSVVQMLSLVVCALYWPNPLVWIGARRLRREAEIAADDAVIAAGMKPSQYAGELLQLAAEFRNRQPAFSTGSLFMAAPSALEARLQSVLAPTPKRSGVTSMDVVKIAGIALFATTALALVCPSLAQEPQSPTVPAAATTPAAPDVAPVPPAPPAEADAPSTPTDAVPPSEATPPTPAQSADPSVHDRSATDDVVILTGSDRKKMRIEIARAQRAAREAIARAKPQIERAMAEAKVGEAVAARAVQEAQPQIDAAIEEIGKARPEMDRAMAEARPELERALKQIRADLAKDHLDVRIQERVDNALKRAEIRIEAVDPRDHESSRQEERTEDSEAPQNN